MLGVFVALAGALGLYQCGEQTDIPTPPYIDENGNVDWDKKYELGND